MAKKTTTQSTGKKKTSAKTPARTAVVKTAPKVKSKSGKVGITIKPKNVRPKAAATVKKTGVKSAKSPAPVRVPRPVSGGTLYSAQKAQMQKAAEHDHVAVVLTEADLVKCKSGLSKKDLDHYLELLLEKRAEILGDVDSIQRDQKSNQGGNLSNMPLHMADIGTENYDQEFNLSLVESERKLLQEIVEAIMRIRKGYYGVCMETGKPIGKPRLDAKPWAKYCIEVARDRERRGEKVF